MKGVGNKSIAPLSKNTSVQNRKKSESQGGDDRENVKVTVTDMADGMSVKSCVAVNIRVLKVSNYHLADLFAIIKQIEDPDLPLRVFPCRT